MSTTPALFCLLLTSLVTVGKGLSQYLLEESLRYKELSDSALERCLLC